MIFRRTPKSKINNRSEFVGLPSIPDPIDDNLYLASAVKAAIVDKESGAYDEFLFSENGIFEMPFEESLEAHLGLVSHRIADQGRRELLVRKQKVMEGESRVALAAAAVDRAQNKLLENDKHLEYQMAILTGEQPGKDNLIWKDAIPEFTSALDSRIKLMIPAIIFLIVGLVDIGIIFISLDGTPGFAEKEAILFSLPALGIQLVFPHLIGDRIRLNSHGSEAKRKHLVEVFILGTLWILFCVAMTFIRIDFINKEAVDGITAGKLSDIIYTVLIIISFLMLVGLGSILIFFTSRANPHYREYYRVNINRAKIKKHLSKTEIELEKAKNMMPVLEYSHDVTKASFEEAAGAVNNALSRAAKKVYRRALVNKYGEVDFTNAYLNSAQALKKNGEN